MVVIVTEQTLSLKTILDRMRREARLTLCQTLPRPSQKRRQAGRRFDRDLCGEHGDEAAEPIQFVEFGEDGAESGSSAIFNMLDARSQLASTALLLDPPLFCFSLEPLSRLRRR
jgi:hypothetical protein